MTFVTLLSTPTLNYDYVLCSFVCAQSSGSPHLSKRRTWAKMSYTDPEFDSLLLKIFCVYVIEF